MVRSRLEHKVHKISELTKPGRPNLFISNLLPFCLIAMNSLDLNQPVILAEEASHEEEEGMSDEHSMTETSNKDSVASSTSNESVIAQDETSAVNRSKFIVYLVLLVTAAAVGTATYFFMSKEEHDEFESEVRYPYVFERSHCDCLYSHC
jgi:hypothetical protein